MEETIDIIEEKDEQEISLENEPAVFGIFPTGTLNISENGEFDVEDYKSANVNVNTQMQEKSINIDANGTQVITPDIGYDGLTQVDIVTNIQPTLQSKVITITQNGTTIVNADTGYDGLEYVEIVGNIISDKNAKINNNELYNANYGIVSQITECDMNGITFTNNSMQNCFINFTGLTTVQNLNTTNVTNFKYCFHNCKSLITAPVMDMTEGKEFLACFYGCHNLQNVPVYSPSSYDLTNGSKLQSMFTGCDSLTNESLNNILQMCINARHITKNKTLSNLGLSETQASTCQTLSNWDAFIAAGWTSGY